MRRGTLLGGRFEIDRYIGGGGMGVVYRANDRRSRSVVAVKLLDVRHADLAHRFDREARILSDLDHPAIVRYLAHGRTATGRPYLVMEWLDGEDLSAYIARTRMAPLHAVALARRVAEALATAHQRGVVHRDIKPGNLFLPGGRVDAVKILDFGIAGLTRISDGSTTPTGARLGTPRYMAPEQARGKKGADPRMDVYALGCVLFECVAGRPPFEGDDDMAVLAKVLLEDAPRLAEIRPDIPYALDSLVARMLAKEAAARSADGTSLAHELSAIEAELTAFAARATPASGANTPELAHLTDGEQQLLCLVLAGPPTGVSHAPPAVPAAAARLAEVVAAHGGRLETLFDGSMVATLAPAPAATDQAAQAARCALVMRAVAPQLPIALAVGRGHVGRRWPVGEVIDRAASLLRRDLEVESRGGGGAEAPTAVDRPGRGRQIDAAAPLPIRVDTVAAGLLEQRFVLDTDGSTHRLCREREAEEMRTVAGVRPSFVGREPELGLLEASFAACVSQPGARVVLVTGAAGLGKTRLGHEFLASARSRGAEVLMARGDLMSVGSPFGMIAPPLRRAAGILDGEPHEAGHAKLRALARRAPEADQTRIGEFLGELAGVPFPDDASPQLRAARSDPRLRGDQMLRAWEDWLAAETADHPVILVLEDLHWGDRPSIKFVDAALRRLGDRPFMVLALARPEIHELFPRLWGERAMQELRLGELPRRASESLAREVLGTAATEEVVTRIAERAAGNAFFLEELIRSVARGERAAPGTVVAMLQARIGALDADARRVLRAASLYGQVFWHGGVEALLGADGGPSLDAWLSALVERELVVRHPHARFPDAIEYQFRHALVRDAVYGLVTETDRVVGHRLAAQWLEEHGERDSLVLAEHYERGAAPERALAWYRRAAEQALEGGDLEAVLGRTARAIACGSTGEVLGGLRLLQAEAHNWRGEHAEAQRCALESMALLPRGSAGWGKSVGEVATASGRLGEQLRLRAMADELVRLKPPRAAAGTCAVAAARLVVQLLHDGSTRSAEGVLAAMDRIAADAGNDPVVIARAHEARSTWALFTGDLGGYLKQIEEAAVAFTAAGDLRNLSHTRANVGYAYLELGMYEGARQALRQALAEAEERGLHYSAAAARHNLGLALARMGELDEARAVERAAAHAFIAQGDRRLAAMSHTYLATIELLAGERGAAGREAATALELQESPTPVRALALATQARVLLAAGDPAGAMTAAGEAMALLERLGSLDEGESLVRWVHAEALHATGRTEEAREAIGAARARVEARAAMIRDPGYRDSFLRRVPENASTLERAGQWTEAAPAAGGG